MVVRRRMRVSAKASRGQRGPREGSSCREKERIARTIREARWPAVRISSKLWRQALGSAQERRPSSESPRIPVRMLLKSCAKPLEIMPMAPRR